MSRFRSTLVDSEADLLLLILMQPARIFLQKEIAVVRSILKDIRADKSDQILVLNKVDLLSDQELQMPSTLQTLYLFLHKKALTVFFIDSRIASAGDPR